MITFKKFFILTESVAFGGISPSTLGFHNSIVDLPEEPPYGFWVDRHGNFIICDTNYSSHVKVATGIYDAVERALGRPTTSLKGREYAYMFDNGAIRVVRGGSRLYYQTYLLGSITNAQKSFLGFVRDLYDLKDAGFDRFG